MPTDLRKSSRRRAKTFGWGPIQIKLATGCGVSSFYDPLDVNEFTAAENEAAVAAAADWRTYVAVHVKTDEATRRSVEASVKSIEHSFLMSDETMQFMKDKGVWLSIQPLLNDEDAFTISLPPLSITKIEVL